MLPRKWRSGQSIRPVCALTLLTAMSCLPWATSSLAQSTVPHPPDRPGQQSTGVAHPPTTQKQQTSDSDDQAGTTFRVNVKLVNVFATVTDAEGRPVSSLKEEDFQVFEDGKPQKIAVFHRESELPL